MITKIAERVKLFSAKNVHVHPMFLNEAEQVLAGHISEGVSNGLAGLSQGSVAE